MKNHKLYSKHYLDRFMAGTYLRLFSGSLEPLTTGFGNDFPLGLFTFGSRVTNFSSVNNKL